MLKINKAILYIGATFRIKSRLILISNIEKEIIKSLFRPNLASQF